MCLKRLKIDKGGKYNNNFFFHINPHCLVLYLKILLTKQIMKLKKIATTTLVKITAYLCLLAG